MALLAARVLAADLSVPDELDGPGWASAWDQVVDAMQDPGLQDTRIAWTRTRDRWVLTLEHGGRRATVDGLVPAGDEAGRIEQLYVALGLVGRTAPASAQSALRARLAPPVPPDAEALVDDVVRISVVDTDPVWRPGPFTAMITLDSQGGGAVRGQLQGPLGPVTAGVRGGFRVDPQVRTGLASSITGRLGMRGGELRGVLESSRRGLVIGLTAGAETRRLAQDGAMLGRGLMPVLGAHVAFVGQGEAAVRGEVGFSHDLAAQQLNLGLFDTVGLASDRVELSVGIRPGRRS